MVETTEATQVTRAVSSLLFPELEFGIAANATYLSEDSHNEYENFCELMPSVVHGTLTSKGDQASPV